MLIERGPIERACRTMVALLDIAYCSGREAELAEHIEIALDAGNLPDPDALRALFIRDSECIHGAAGLPVVAVTPTPEEIVPVTPVESPAGISGGAVNRRCRGTCK
jgi:hypothetical protein